MQIAVVDNSFCLALAALNGFGRNEMNLGSYAEHGAHCGLERTLSLLSFGHDVGKLLGGKLDINVKCVVVALSAHNDLIVGGISLVEQNGFNLRGKYVYPWACTF